MLLPYATRSRLMPWKRRVFTFSSTDKQSLFEGYNVYDPPGDCLPFHLDDKFRYDFLKYFLTREKSAVSYIKQAFNFPEFNPTNANDLDKIGEMVSNFIDLRPTVKKRKKSFSAAEEMSWEPIWNSILLDISLCIGLAVKEAYRAAEPRWDLVENKARPYRWVRAPIMYLKKSCTPKFETEALKKEYEIEMRFKDAIDIMPELMEEDPDQLMEEFKKEYEIKMRFEDAIDKMPELIDDWEKWSELVINTLLEINGSADDEVADYKPGDYVKICKDDEKTFSPIDMMWSFAWHELLVKYEFLRPIYSQNYHYASQSLGDVLRPDTHPNWTDFPDQIKGSKNIGK